MEEQERKDSEPLPSTESDVHTSGLLNSNVTDQQWRAMQDMLLTVYNHRTENGQHDPSKLFHRKVNKRAIPDYYEIIKEPMALSTVKQKINNREYKDFTEFVRDFALIPHNAQVYNRVDSLAFQDALEIKRVIEREFQKFVDDKIVTSDTAMLPYLGEIPEAEDPPEEEEDEESEDDESGDESDESRSGKRKRGRPRGSTAAKKAQREQEEADEEARKRRGRPPRVDTPTEARIKNILKGLRRPKHGNGDFKIVSFDRLPDKAQMPEYFREIQHPVAVDTLKKKLKRKKYQSVEQFMRDVELMFENAKKYNEDDSQIYQDAVELQKEARRLAEEENNKPDSEFAMEDGRLPLPNGILYNGELYKVGDWVHILNPNDLTKPIVAQIYRTFQDAQNQQFINACWYYRPEQTVHRFDRHFFESEVVKTGQYRDHKVDEIVDRCFVMFITRFNKGRPRGFPDDKQIYVCEARYNEEKHTLNKIKTWASCLPDEVRDKDYEMELFAQPKKMKKLPSPIAYLLKGDAKEIDELPRPEWGADNAPPKIGAVHKRPRDPKESPPPEPTPTPPPAETTPPPPPQPQRQASNTNGPTLSDFAAAARQNSQDTANRQPNPAPHTQPVPPIQNYSQTIPSPVATTTRPPNDMRTSSSSTHTPNASYPRSNLHPQNYQPTSYNSNIERQPPTAPAEGRYRYSNMGVSNNYLSGGNSTGTATYSNVASGSAGYKPPQSVEVWALDNTANAYIPEDVRRQFQCDDLGRILFFTSAPLDTEAKQWELDGEAGSRLADIALGHSAKYRANKRKWDEMRRQHCETKAKETKHQQTEQAAELLAWRREKMELATKQTKEAIDRWQEEMTGWTLHAYRRAYDREENPTEGLMDEDEDGQSSTEGVVDKSWTARMARDLDRLRHDQEFTMTEDALLRAKRTRNGATGVAGIVDVSASSE